MNSRIRLVLVSALALGCAGAADRTQPSAPQTPAEGRGPVALPAGRAASGSVWAALQPPYALDSEGRLFEFVGPWVTAMQRSRGEWAKNRPPVVRRLDPPAAYVEISAYGDYTSVREVCGRSAPGDVICQPPENVRVDLPRPARQVDGPCALLTDGRTFCWPRYDGPHVATAISAAPLAQSIARGSGNLLCLLGRDGAVRCATLDFGGGESVVGPFHRIPLEGTVEQIVVGLKFGCARLAGGSVACWRVDPDVPGNFQAPAVAPLPPMVKLDSDVHSFCGISDRGEVHCCVPTAFAWNAEHLALPDGVSGRDLGVSDADKICVLGSTGAVYCDLGEFGESGAPVPRRLSVVPEFSSPR